MRHETVGYRRFTLLRCLCWIEVGLLLLALLSTVS